MGSTEQLLSDVMIVSDKPPHTKHPKFLNPHHSNYFSLRISTSEDATFLFKL